MRARGLGGQRKDRAREDPQVNPDIVTLDIEMPEMDGLETLAEIRKTHPKLPVIMFSTLTERAAAATLKALALGATDYVTKPSGGSLEASLEQVREQLLPKLRAFGVPGAAGPRPPAPMVARPAQRSPALRTHRRRCNRLLDRRPQRTDRRVREDSGGAGGSGGHRPAHAARIHAIARRPAARAERAFGARSQRRRNTRPRRHLDRSGRPPHDRATRRHGVQARAPPGPPGELLPARCRRPISFGRRRLRRQRARRGHDGHGTRRTPRVRAYPRRPGGKSSCKTRRPRSCGECRGPSRPPVSRTPSSL